MTSRSLFIASSVSSALVAACLLTSQGCSNQPANKPDKTTSKAVDKKQFTVTNTLAALHPTEFEIGVPRELPSGELNAWAEVMLPDLIDPDVDDAKLKTALQPYLNEAAIERVLRRVFVPRDSVEVRDALWARIVAESVAKTTDSELERVVRLFRFVLQNLHVLNDDKVPLALFDRMQLGFGRPNDRAWAFASLVQQLKLNSIIIEPTLPEADAAKSSVIVGVLIDADIYLFDMTVGLPIPALDDDPKQTQIGKVATLKQVLASDDVLRQLDLEGNPYPYQSAQFKTAKVSVIGDTSLWSRRFEALQNGMAKDSTAIIFQPLVSVGSFEGVIDLVATAVKDQIPTENISVWMYSDERREQRESLSTEQLTGLKMLFDPFQAPRPLIIRPLEEPKAGEAPVKLEFGKGWNYLLVARTEQLVGQTGDAISKYLKLQGWSRLPPTPPKAPAVPPEAEAEVARMIPEDIQQLHARAAELALFWRASSQLSNGEYGTAASDFETYITRIDGGLFPTQARYLAGLSTALDGRWGRAAAFLSRVDKNDPQYRAARVLMRRWKALAEASDAAK